MLGFIRSFNGRYISFYKIAVVLFFYNFFSLIVTQKYLLLDEITNLPNEKKITDFDRVGEITLQDASAKWESTSQEYTLQNLNLNLKKGSLTAVVGHVGAGKVKV